MNGAVHGDATITASTPVPKLPRQSDLPTSASAARVLPMPLPNVNSYTPSRFSPMTKKSTVSDATTHGVCNWKPQPSALPACCKAISSPASSTKDRTTPTAKAMPCTAIGPLWVRCCASPISFSDSTGNTQGIRFRIRPPTNAAPRAASSDIVGVVDGTAAAVPAAAVATAPATSGASTVAVQPPDFAGPPLATITPASVFESALTGFAAVSVSASPLAAVEHLRRCGFDAALFQREELELVGRAAGWQFECDPDSVGVDGTAGIKAG